MSLIFTLGVVQPCLNKLRFGYWNLSEVFPEYSYIAKLFSSSGAYYILVRVSQVIEMYTTITAVQTSPQAEYNERDNVQHKHTISHSHVDV